MKTKLITLSVLLLSAFALKAQQGEITYIDFDPDTLVELKDIDHYPDSKMNIDLDFDNIPDIKIYQYTTSTGCWFNIRSYEPEWEIHEYEVADTLGLMNDPELWWSGAIFWLPYFYHDIDTMSDRFAVRHKVGDSYYYGWLRIYITSCPPSLYPWAALDRMAYCTVPDYPLVWGQTELVGIDETVKNDFSVYPNPANGVLFVEAVHAPSLPDQTYRITNIMGQTLLQGSINAEIQQINIASLPAGLYFLSVGNTTQKFVKR
jgi:hypothetical protein